MKEIEIILSIVATSIGLLISTLTFLAKFIKCAKAKIMAESLVKIGNAILPYIEQAETFIHYTGAEKKEFVMTKANQYALANKLPFDAEAVGQKIEDLIILTKQVNHAHSTIIQTKECGLIIH